MTDEYKRFSMFTIKLVTNEEKDILYIKELNNYIFVKKEISKKISAEMITKEELLHIFKEESSEEYEKIIKLINSWENLQEKECNSNSISSIYTLCIHPVRRCNYECDYCYAKTSEYLPVNEISLETAKKAIDFMTDNWGRDAKRYVIDLAGSGEPLLRFDFIKEIDTYCELKRTELGKDIKIMFPSNGSLITEEILEYFENNNNVLLGISIDGNERHNINRKFNNRKLAYDTTVNAINLLKKRNVGLAATVTHQNEDVDVVYDFLFNNFNNADAISLQVVRDFEKSSPTSFYNINLENLFYHYEVLVKNIYTNVINGNYNYIKKILIGTDTLGVYICKLFGKGTLHRKRCGAGSCILSVDENGDLYLCSVVNGNKDFKVGDIYNGLEKETISNFKDSNIEKNKYCKNCWAAFICSGECFVTSYLTHGEMEKPNEDMCSFRKKLIYLAIQFVGKLQLHNPMEYSEVLKIVKNRMFFESVIESSIWVLKIYLEEKGINVEYSELEDQISSTQFGTRPEELKSVMSRYVDNVSAYNINKVERFEDIKYPAIALVNKGNVSFYQYLIICGNENNKLRIRIPFASDETMVSSLYFLNKISDIVVF